LTYSFDGDFMRREKSIGICLLAWLILNTIFSMAAIAQESSLATATAKNQYALKLENGRLTGAGADFLLKEAQGSQFFLIGEDHGIAELPLFTEALFKAIQPSGYNHYVTETGPATAQTVIALASSKDSNQAFEQFFAKYPFSIPFFAWREEAQVAKTVLNTVRDKSNAIAGIDQEFVLSPVFLFDKLAEMATDKKIKDLLQQLSQHESDAVKKSFAAKNPMAAASFMTDAREPDLTNIENHFRSSKNAFALTLIEELKASRAVYQKFFTGKYYENNYDRSKLIKKHFLSYYKRISQDGKSQPKLLLKMGAMHTKRGHSFLGIQDIGNLLSELAVINQTASFHLLVVVASGNQNGYSPFADESAKQSKIEVGYGKEFAELAPKDSWTVFDLRPLRADVRKLSGSNNLLKEIILGYDAVLVISKGHAAKLFE
jgi:hypothetical protein